MISKKIKNSLLINQPPKGKPQNLEVGLEFF